jgi:hypothetical protein
MEMLGMLTLGILALIFFMVEWMGKLILIAVLTPFIILIIKAHKKNKLNGASLDKPKSANTNNQESVATTAKPPISLIAGLGMLLVGGFIFMISTKYLVSMMSGSNAEPTVGNNSTMAFVQCKSFVNERLKAPHTADFPFLDRESINMGDNTYVIRSYVDSQNSFGAMIRNKTFCKVKWNGTEEANIKNWKLIELVMNE